MKSRFALPLAAAVCALGLTAGSALAVNYNWTADLVVPAGTTPNDLHITFTGTGGSVKNPTANPPVGTGSVTAPASPGNRIDVVWDTKLAGGNAVTLTFTTAFPDIGFGGGFWTNDGDTLGPVSSHPDSLDITQNTTTPGASPLTMALVALLIAGTGVMMLRRRAIA